MERFFKLTKRFDHPFTTYPAGAILSAKKWAEILGHETTEERFIQLVREKRIDCFEEVQTDLWGGIDYSRIKRGKA